MPETDQIRVSTVVASSPRTAHQRPAAPAVAVAPALQLRLLDAPIAPTAIAPVDPFPNASTLAATPRLAPSLRRRPPDRQRLRPRSCVKLCPDLGVDLALCGHRHSFGRVRPGTRGRRRSRSRCAPHLSLPAPTPQGRSCPRALAAAWHDREDVASASDDLARRMVESLQTAPNDHCREVDVTAKIAALRSSEKDAFWPSAARITFLPTC